MIDNAEPVRENFDGSMELLNEGALPAVLVVPAVFTIVDDVSFNPLASWEHRCIGRGDMITMSRYAISIRKGGDQDRAIADCVMTQGLEEAKKNRRSLYEQSSGQESPNEYRLLSDC